MVGSGKVRVVEFKGRITLVDGGGVGIPVPVPGAKDDPVPLVGSGKVRVVEFKGRTTLVDAAGAGTPVPFPGGRKGDPVPLVGSGKVRVVVFKGRTTLVDGGGGGTAVPVPFVVGAGGTCVEDTGATSVVEFRGMKMVVATAVPFTVIVSMLAVTEVAVAETDKGSDVMLPVGEGIMRVVELTGTMMLVIAVLLTVTVPRLAVTVALLPGTAVAVAGMDKGDDVMLPVGRGPTRVVELRGTIMLVSAVPLTVTVARLAVTVAFALLAVAAVVVAGMGKGSDVKLPVGSGPTRVVELRGTMMLVIAVPLMVTVPRLAVTVALLAVGNG